MHRLLTPAQLEFSTDAEKAVGRLQKSTVYFVGSSGSANNCAEGLRNFGYNVLQPRNADRCAGLFAGSEKPELVICEEPCLMSDGSILFDSLKATRDSAGVQYLSLTTLALARAESARKTTDRDSYMIKPIYLEQVIMQVRWLIGAPSHVAA